MRNPPVIFGRIAIGSQRRHLLITFPALKRNQLAKRVVGLRAVPLIPVAQNQSLTTRQALNITIAATSPGGLPLTYAVVTMPTHGTLSWRGPEPHLYAGTGYAGPDTFTFQATTES